MASVLLMRANSSGAEQLTFDQVVLDSTPKRSGNARGRHGLAPRRRARALAATRIPPHRARVRSGSGGAAPAAPCHSSPSRWERAPSARVAERRAPRGLGRRLVVAIAVVTLACGCATASETAGPRPKAWASPVAAGQELPNLFRVSSSLYRSAQPSREGFEFLSTGPSLADGDAPIKTVVSLRASSEGDDPLVPETSGLRLVHIPVRTWRLEDEDVVAFLRVATSPDMQPVLVHCHHGSDRTGAMIAVYRVVVEGWTKAQATDEMVHGGYGFHPMWRNLIRYVEDLDVDAMKAKLAQAGPWQ